MQPTAPWPRTVLFDKQSFLCKTELDLESTFNDYQTILGLGGRSLLTFPIICDGTVLGAVNLTGGQGAYDQNTLGTTDGLAQMALGAFRQYEGRQDQRSGEHSDSATFHAKSQL